MKKFLVCLSAVIILAVFAIFTLGNNLFMARIFTQNPLNMSQDIEEELGSYENALYYDLFVTELVEYNQQGITNEVSIKLLNTDVDNGKYDFTAHLKQVTVMGETTTTEEMELNYIAGTLYKNNLTTNQKTRRLVTYDYAISCIFVKPHAIFPTNYNILNNADTDSCTYKANWMVSLNPFYFGQNYKITKIDDENSYCVFKFDMLRNLKAFESVDASTNYHMITNINSINKVVVSTPIDAASYSII